MSIGVRKSSDHVDGNVHPQAGWYCVRIEWGYLGLGAQLRSLACFASFDICFDVLHLGPPVFPEDQLFRFLDAEMSGGDVVMTSCDDVTAEGAFLGNVDTSIVL